MLPTPDVQPAPYRPIAPAGGVPAPVQALRVVAWIEVAVLVAGTLLGLGTAALAATSLDASGEAAAWATAFVVFGLGSAAICTVLALLVGVPLLLLRGARAGRTFGALVTTCCVHAVFAVGALVFAVVSGANVAPTTAFLPLLLAGVAATVVVLSLQPSSQQWARQS